jgi:hypothetical protein
MVFILIQHIYFGQCSDTNSLVVQRTLAQYAFRAYKLTVFLNENIGFQATESWTRSLKGISLVPRNSQKWPELLTSKLFRSFLHH